MTTRRGATLPELLVALVVAGIVAAFAFTGAARLADSLAARGAARELRAALLTARHLAVLRATRAALAVDTTRAVLVVHVAAESALVRDVGASFGVRVSASRDTLAYGADGLGWGAANARLVLRRGAAAETVTVSRLGRVR
jgi:prepilin-type N-terminal cleavage/methylation domain-containing protein